MKRWEYMRVAGYLEEDFDRELAALGAEGWEAVGFAIGSMGHVLLKRPLPDAAPDAREGDDARR